MRTAIGCLVAAILLTGFFATVLATPLSLLVATSLLDGLIYGGVVGPAAFIIGIFLPYSIFIFSAMIAVDLLTVGELRKSILTACIPLGLPLAFLFEFGHILYEAS